MITSEEHYEFLKKYYRAQRFEERNGNTWGECYSHNIAKHHYQDLQNYGYSLISRYEAKNGEGVIYDADLRLLKGVPQKKQPTSAGKPAHD